MEYALYRQTAEKQFLEAAYEEAQKLNRKTEDAYEKSFLAMIDDNVIAEYNGKEIRAEYDRDYCKDKEICYGIMIQPLFSVKGTLYVGSNKPYKTLSHALHSAAEGSEIIVSKGKYEDFFEIDKDITITGNGKVIFKQKADKENIAIISNGNAKISGIDFKGIKKGKNSSIVYISEGSPEIFNCSFFKGNCGISIAGNGKANIHDCKIHDNKRFGIEIRGNANPTVRNCELHCNHEGLKIHEQAAGSYENCNIHDNSRENICIESKASPKVS